jgi:hypothetical protein
MSIIADTRTFTSRAELIAHYRAVRQRLGRTPRQACHAESVVQPTKANLIIAAACAEYGIARGELFGPLRVGKVAEARAIAIYLLRELTGRSDRSIGRTLRRSPDIVLHAHVRVTRRMREDAIFAARVAVLSIRLAGIAVAPTRKGLGEGCDRVAPPDAASSVQHNRKEVG